MDFTLLIVDDEDNFREGLKEYFSEKFSVADAGNLTDARNILASTPVDIILLDVQVGLRPPRRRAAPGCRRH